MSGIELAVTVIALKESWLRSPRDLDPEEGAIPEGSRPNTSSDSRQRRGQDRASEDGREGIFFIYKKVKVKVKVSVHLHGYLSAVPRTRTH